MLLQELDLPIQEIKKLCQRYRVRELALFGSVLREDFNEASDIDLLVEFEPDARVSFLTLAKMQRELSTMLHRRVDLVPKNGLKPRIRENVLNNAKVIYAT
ncbi:MAG: nucleotidyltransferase family protein [Anaerolineae bacterium]|nr:nucleotidyltransferase family protein [Anaerolineae bacterium]